MTKQTRGSNRKGRRGDPNQDVQPWLGWIAAMFVVVIVVIAVAMGMQRTGDQRNGAAEVRMTPLVGGMEVPVATETGAAVAAASEVTPLPQPISETTSMTMVTVMTSTGALSETDTFTATGEMTPTESLTVTTEITDMTALILTEAATASPEVGATAEVTVEATIEATPTFAPTVEPTVEATPTEVATPAATDVIPVEATPTPRPTTRPTVTPSVTPSVVMRVFASGDTVVASVGRVEIYADATQDSIVLDSFGPGVALEVLDVGGDFESYPVEVDGHGWARVRAADGLVGWVMTDQVEVQ